MPIRPFLPALAVALALAGPVSAQGTAAPSAAPASLAAAPAAGSSRVDRVTERRIEDLHDKLKITAAQQKAFDDFAAAMRDNARRVDGAVAQRHTNLATATAVEQMQTYADMAQAHAEDVQHLLPPFTTLYNALSPQQKRLADTSFREFSAKARARATRS